MNHVTLQPVAVETAKQAKTPKEQSSADSKFMNMLSDAINGKPQETVKPPEQAQKPAETANDPNQSPTQTQSDEQPSVPDHEDSITGEQQAVAAAMQMFPAPVIIMETPQAEALVEIINPETEITAIQQVQSVQAGTVETEQIQPDTAQSIYGDTAKTVQATAEKPQTEEAAAQTRPAEETAPRAVRTEEPAPDTTKTNPQQPQTEVQAAQRQTIRQEPEAVHSRPTEDTADKQPVEAVENAEPVVQEARQSRPSVPMHQMRDPRESEAAQSRFDGMIAKASQELNQGAAVQEVQTEADTEVPEETPITEKPVILETKPQEPAKQADIPKTEAKPDEDVKPETQATVQKSVKAPVTEQRPQQELSKSDEALLNMTTSKQPEATHEIIRSEPAPQAPQPVRVPDQAEQIKAQVIKNLENERTEFQMQLQPEELGKVNVKMILEGGKLSVEIAAVNPKSVEMLSKQAESLAASLKATGADVTSVNVVTATDSASAQMNSEYDLNQFRNGRNGQEQSGRSSGTRGNGEADENDAQPEREAAKAPQRILNYSV